MENNLLLIDDEINILNSIKRLLRKENYNVITANSGKEAIEIMKTHDISVIVCDQKMPNMSGLEVLKESLKLVPNAIRIALTGLKDVNYMVELINNTHIHQFLMKPCDNIYLKHVINKAFEQYYLTQRNRLLQETIVLQNETLIEQNKRLEKLDAIKSEFVATVSHEFKNPLTALRETINFVIDLVDDPQQKKLLGLGETCANRLIRLVSDLLNLSAIESGKLNLNVTSIDISSLVKEIIELNAVLWKQKNISIICDITEKLSLDADQDKLAQVFTNLVSNAIKHSPQDGVISLTIKDFDNEVECSISDQGKGIPEEYLEKIFNKYERIRSESKEGTGLGLPIVKDIISLHKGKIWVKTELGKGSTFFFVLPKILSCIENDLSLS